MVYFANQTGVPFGGGWAMDSDPNKAALQARYNVGVTAKEAAKAESYVLEFPDEAIVTVDNLTGAVSWDHAPLRLVVARNMNPDRVAMLRLQCEANPDGRVTAHRTGDNTWMVYEGREDAPQLIAKDVSEFAARIIANALNLTNA
jgi:hypothetical protein